MVNRKNMLLGMALHLICSGRVSARKKPRDDNAQYEFSNGRFKEKQTFETGERIRKRGTSHSSQTTYESPLNENNIPIKTRRVQSAESSQCLDRFSAVFLQFSALPQAIYVDPFTRNTQELGTRFIYSDNLRFLPSLDVVPGSRASGTCTRVQSRLGNDEIGLQLGMGHCDFTYRLANGDREVIFTATGEIADSTGGVLSITGGARSAFGAYGEVVITPVTIQPDGSVVSNEGDVFLEPNFYKVEATLVFPCK